MKVTINSPFGPLYLQASGRGVSFLGFRDSEGEPDCNSAGAQHDAAAILESATLALARYFEGDGVALDAVPVDVRGTEFQRAVWFAARAVSFGNTLSYGALASSIGRPLSSRAVGAALGANPVCIIIPCHRIISSVGKLHGFSGGLDKKEKLLRHEHAVFVSATNLETPYHAVL